MKVFSFGRLRTWPVAALGLGGLLVLIVGSLQASSRKAADIYSQIDRLDTHHNTVDATLRRLRSDIHLSSIYIRDSLLDLESEHAAEYRQTLAGYRTNSKAAVRELHELTDQHEDRLRGLEAQLDAYWRAFEPVFDWSPAEKLRRSADFLRQEVVPRREAVLGLALEIESLNEANLADQRAEAARRYASFQSDLSRIIWQSSLLGLVVALVAVYRLRVLELRSDVALTVAERAEQQMRQLSQRLVATQEAERKNLSRELHDHVAQVLTALKMEIGRIDRASAAGDTRLGGAVAECRRLVDLMFRTVRNLASGLRPSMLDNLGLQAALEWQVRDFTSRFGVDVELTMDGDFGGLPDRYGICIYRTIQEALTNCARHASAGSVSVRVSGRPERLEVQVSDDGIGIDPVRRHGGLGLRGIEERVRELGGAVSIGAGPGKGTLLAFHLPLPACGEDVSLASATS